MYKNGLYLTRNVDYTMRYTDISTYFGLKTVNDGDKITIQILKISSLVGVIFLSSIITIHLSVISASGILGIGTRAILARMKEQEMRQKALEFGVQALLRDRMLHCYNKYIDAGFAPIFAKENYENMYQQYHELGGNGVMTHLHEEFMALPTEKGA